MILVLGWVLLSSRFPRFAAIWRKSCVFSFLRIRKVLVFSFAVGFSPPLPVVSILFSVSYPQARRSYYLFFNYLFFNYLYGYALCTYSRGLRYALCTYLTRMKVCALHVENCPESHKPVEIDGLRTSDDSVERGIPRSPTCRPKAPDGPLRGREGALAD